MKRLHLCISDARIAYGEAVSRVVGVWSKELMDIERWIDGWWGSGARPCCSVVEQTCQLAVSGNRSRASQPAAAAVFMSMTYICMTYCHYHRPSIIAECWRTADSTHRLSDASTLQLISVFHETGQTACTQNIPTAFRLLNQLTNKIL